MLKLNSIEQKEKLLNDEISRLKKEVETAERNLSLIRRKYDFVCKKCGIAYKKDECAYRMWEFGRTHEDCQPMGDYDVWQTIEKEARYCCPKCGKDFKESYGLHLLCAETRKYGRWEDERPALFHGWHYDKPITDEIFLIGRKKSKSIFMPFKKK